MTKAEYLIQVATRFLGVHEEGGNNKGPEVEVFQKAIGGAAVGQSWCMDFVEYCVRLVEQELKCVTQLALSQNCLQVWESTAFKARFASPEPGSVVIWNRVGTRSGHTGIVTEVIDDVWFRTIEGNTTPGQAFQSEGDGVYRKLHRRTPGPGWRIMGYLRPFPLDPAPAS